MRIRIIYCILFCGFLSFTTTTNSAILPSSVEKIIPVADIYAKIANLKIKDVQKMIGRKLTLKEKIGFIVLKHKLRHPAKETTNSGETSFIFGIAGAVLLIAGLFFGPLLLGSLIAAIIAIVTGSVAKKRNSSDWKAHAGKLLGWITLGLIALLLILIAIVLSGWVWGWG